MKTKLEIIEETAKAYTSNTRGYNEITETCVYVNDDGNKCAVGRCLDLSDDRLDDLSGAVSMTGTVYCRLEGENINLEDILKEEYKGHHPDFWRELQVLHDCHSNWNEQGLSDLGLAKKKELIKKWGE